jgi:DNA-binding transcriptional regulator YiaG
MTSEKMKIKKIPFDIHIPNLDGNGIAETVRVEVDAYFNPETGEDVLTPESLELIERTQARHMGLLSAEEIKALRERLGLTQNEMSNLLQIGAKTYTRWESGRARPSRSLNVLLCALRDGQLDMNYLCALRDPSHNKTWFGANRSRAVFLSFHGHIQPTQQPEFKNELWESCSAWFGRFSDLWTGSSQDVVFRISNETQNAPWLLPECKSEQTIEYKPTIRRTLTTSPPSWRGKKTAWRARHETSECESNISS